MIFRVRELLIRQRTQAIHALRGHLTEFGQIVPQGAANASKLIAIVEDADNALPVDAIPTLQVLVSALLHLRAEIAKLDAEIARRAKENDVARRLMTVPGVRWSTDRHGYRGPCPATGDIPQGTRLCRLAGSSATAAFNRRETTPRHHH
jgi:transposase